MGIYFSILKWTGLINIKTETIIVVYYQVLFSIKMATPFLIKNTRMIFLLKLTVYKAKLCSIKVASML